MSDFERAKRLWLMPVWLRARMLASEMSVQELASIAGLNQDDLVRYLNEDEIPCVFSFDQWRAIRFFLLPDRGSAVDIERKALLEQIDRGQAVDDYMKRVDERLREMLGARPLPENDSHKRAANRPLVIDAPPTDSS